jgi:hypothetical protein
MPTSFWQILACRSIYSHEFAHAIGSDGSDEQKKANKLLLWRTEKLDASVKVFSQPPTVQDSAVTVIYPLPCSMLTAEAHTFQRIEFVGGRK